MKTIKQFLLSIILLAISINAFSVENNNVRADTLRIKTGNFLLEVATFDLNKNTLEKANIQDKVNKLLKQLEKVVLMQPEAGEKVCIRWSNFVGGEEHDFYKLSLQLEERNQMNLLVHDGEVLQTDFGKYVFEIEDKNYLIRLHFVSMAEAEKFGSEEFMESISDAVAEIPENRKKTNVWLVENESKSFNPHFLGETPPYTLDMLELSAGIGTGIIKNDIVTGFNFRVGLAFAKKGIMKSKYFVDYEMVYSFPDPHQGSRFTTNDFLSIGYEYNFSLNPDKAKWYGVSLGYLVNRNNDVFEKNTFKIGVHKQLTKSISLKPEIYFNDFFKNVYPGLGIKISF